jgi:cytochrome c556
MRKVLIVISVCMIAAVSLTLYAQQRELQPIMKEIQPTSGGLTTGMRGRTMSAADVAKDAEKLQKLFTEVSSFMKEKNIADAVGFANDAANASAELAKAAKANEADPMFAAQKVILKQCQNCHAAHREQLPDKTFKLKVR